MKVDKIYESILMPEKKLPHKFIILLIFNVFLSFFRKNQSVTRLIYTLNLFVDYTQAIDFQVIFT